LEAINDALRLELKPRGIEVSIVEPGAIKTPIWDKGISGADEFLAQIPEGQRDLYDKVIEAIRGFAVKTAGTAIPPSSVAKAVEHALTAARPKTRYVVGKDAKIQALINHLPGRWRDALIYKFVGLA
jgi:NAD(P)-dependent dehydrogenase (short-subunit alcohol dehydrogenase family)